MSRINPKTGLRYVTGVKWKEQEKWKVTQREAIALIDNDPDLTRLQKSQAKRDLAKRFNELLASNDRKEGMALLNKLYAKAHGVTAEKQTPFATFIKTSVIRRGQH